MRIVSLDLQENYFQTFNARLMDAKTPCYIQPYIKFERSSDFVIRNLRLCDRLVQEVVSPLELMEPICLKSGHVYRPAEVPDHSTDSRVGQAYRR